MNICELRLYNKSGVVIERVSFISSPFSLPNNIQIQKPSRRQIDTGESLFRHGSDLAEFKYNNAEIKLSPVFSMQNCTEDESSGMIELMRAKIDRMIERSLSYSLRQTLDYVRFVEDTKGFPLHSEIIDGSFEIGEDWSWSNYEQGVIADSIITLVRRPFRSRELGEVVRNYITNPSFEVCTSSHCYPGWTTNGDSPQVIFSNPTDSVDDDKSMKITEVGGISSGGHHIKHISNQLMDFNEHRTNVVAVNYFLLYAEAWMSVDGVVGKDRWDFWVNGVSTGQKVSWTPSETPIYKDRRWYRNRWDNEEDRDTPEAYLTRKKFIRKGIFVAVNIGSSFPALNNQRLVEIGIKHTNLLGGVMANDSSVYADKLYMTPAVNFLTKTKVDEITSRIAGVGYMICDPSTVPSHIDIMPKAWGSCALMSDVFDHASGLASYLDIDGVEGDAPAKVKITMVGSGVAGAAVMGLRSFGSKYFTRNSLVIPNSQLSPLPANNTNLISTSIAQRVVGNTSFNTHAGSVQFFINSGLGRTKKSGIYNVIARLSNSSDWSKIRIRFAIQIGFSNQFLYGKEITPLKMANQSSTYTTVDLGQIKIPDTQNDTTTILLVQYRVTSGSEIINTDSIILIPSDEWYSAYAAPDTGSIVPTVFGSIDERDLVSLSPVTTAYISGKFPYLVGGIKNRIFVSSNKKIASGYFFSQKTSVADYWYNTVNTQIAMQLEYRERYL